MPLSFILGNFNTSIVQPVDSCLVPWIPLFHNAWALSPFLPLSLLTQLPFLGWSLQFFFAHILDSLGFMHCHPCMAKPLPGNPLSIECSWRKTHADWSHLKFTMNNLGWTFSNVKHMIYWPWFTHFPISPEWLLHQLFLVPQIPKTLSTPPTFS